MKFFFLEQISLVVIEGLARRYKGRFVVVFFVLLVWANNQGVWMLLFWLPYCSDKNRIVCPQ